MLARMRTERFPLGAAVTVEQLEGDPHALMAALREAEPVSWLPAIGGWLVTRRDLALTAMRDAGAFTVQDPRFTTAQVVGPSKPGAPLVPALRLHGVTQVLPASPETQARGHEDIPRLSAHTLPQHFAETRLSLVPPRPASRANRPRMSQSAYKLSPRENPPLPPSLVRNAFKQAAVVRWRTAGEQAAGSAKRFDQLAPIAR